jgi:trimeric autotransporter adhesin
MRIRKLTTTGLATFVCVLAAGLTTASAPALAAASPIIEEEGSSAVTPFTATIAAGVNVNAEEQSTTLCVFEYGKTAAYGSSVTCQQGELYDSPGQVASAELSGLEADTTYHYRLVVETAEGKTEGADGELTTLALAAPSVERESASGLSPAGATLEAEVNPNYQATSYAFEYAPNATGNTLEGAVTTVAGSAPLSGVGAQAASVEVLGQQPETIYYYRVVATNNAGQVDGPVVAYRTLPAPLETAPVVLTGAALDVTQLSATLTGTVQTRELPTTVQFEFGTSTAGGALQPAAVTPGSQSGSSEGIEAAFGDYLQAGTTYYYRAVASNQYGTGYGAWESFSTGSLAALPTITTMPTLAFASSPTARATTTPSTGKKTLSKAKKLAAALKACARKPKKQRAGCERQARRKYGKAKKK